MHDDNLDKQAVEAGQRATALLGLYLESFEKDTVSVSLPEVKLALGGQEGDEAYDVGELLMALVGISISLMIALNPEDPRAVLEKIALGYAEEADKT